MVVVVGMAVAGEGGSSNSILAGHAWHVMTCQCAVPARFRVGGGETGYIQGIYRVYTRYILGIHSVYMRYIEGIYKVYTRYIQGIYKVYVRYMQDCYIISACFWHDYKMIWA